MTPRDLLDFRIDLMKLLIRPGKHRYRTVVPRSPSSGGSASALCAVWEKLDYAEESADTVWTQE